MNTQKLTYGGMLSALIVATTVFAMMTGIGYTVYLDLVLPILIGLIYMKCGFKYTSLCGMISISIIFFGLGDLPTAVWMIQSVIIGLICSVVIFRESTLMDDLLGCSIGGAFIIVFIDIYCENILGMSIIKELWKTLEPFPVPDVMKEVAVSIGLASLPVGTSLIAYIGILFTANRLHLLTGQAKYKFKVIKNLKVWGGYLCCSRSIANRWMVYLVGIQLLTLFKLPLYVKTVLGTVQWIALYFLLRDAYHFVSKYIYTKTKSIGLTKGMGLGVLMMLFSRFRLTAVLLAMTGFVVDTLYHVRDQQIKILSQRIS